MRDRSLYKILTPDQWTALQRDGSTSGSPLDQRDGFVHFSTRAQLQGTLDLHFKDAGPLILAQVPLGSLNSESVKWEPARDGSLFPHLYAALPLSAVIQDWALHPDGQGRYALPDLPD